MQQENPSTPDPFAKPDYLTEKQWTGLLLSVLTGAAEGAERAELKGGWGNDLGLAAVRGLRARLDELVSEEGTPSEPSS
ncbi:hypothetical protein [Streptomyces sp. NPDC003635]